MTPDSPPLDPILIRLLLDGLAVRAHRREYTAPGFNRTIDRQIYSILDRAEIGMTQEDVHLASDLPYRSVTPRFRPMTREGFIFMTGKRRRTTLGRTAMVYKTRRWLTTGEERYGIEAYREYRKVEWEAVFDGWLRALRYLVLMLKADVNEEALRTAGELYSRMFTDVYGYTPNKFWER